MSERCLFFATDPGHRPEPSALDAGLSERWWRPSGTGVTPPGSLIWPFVAWWVCHWLRIFRSRDYAVLLIHDNDVLVHRSCVFPKFIRFPFMSPGDLQIGDVWTAPDARGKGLAKHAIATILREFPARRLWYVTEEANVPSVALALQTRMTLRGIGLRTKGWGVSPLAQFRITEPKSS